MIKFPGSKQAQRVFKVNMLFPTSVLCNEAGQGVLRQKVKNAINALNRDWNFCSHSIQGNMLDIVHMVYDWEAGVRLVKSLTPFMSWCHCLLSLHPATRRRVYFDRSTITRRYKFNFVKHKISLSCNADETQ